VKTDKGIGKEGKEKKITKERYRTRATAHFQKKTNRGKKKGLHKKVKKKKKKESAPSKKKWLLLTAKVGRRLEGGVMSSFFRKKTGCGDRSRDHPTPGQGGGEKKKKHPALNPNQKKNAPHESCQRAQERGHGSTAVEGCMAKRKRRANPKPSTGGKYGNQNQSHPRFQSIEKEKGQLQMGDAKVKNGKWGSPKKKKRRCKNWLWRVGLGSKEKNVRDLSKRFGEGAPERAILPNGKSKTAEVKKTRHPQNIQRGANSTEKEMPSRLEGKKTRTQTRWNAGVTLRSKKKKKRWSRASDKERNKHHVASWKGGH